MVSTNPVTNSKVAGKRPRAVSYLMDQGNNLSVVFARAQADAPGPAYASPFEEDSACGELQAWIQHCNQRIHTVQELRQEDASEAQAALLESRAAVLARFPANLHFVIGALFDFSNEQGLASSPLLVSRLGQETQALVLAMHALRQLTRGHDAGAEADDPQGAFTRSSSEATWLSYHDSIHSCCRKRRYLMTLDSFVSTLLPVLTPVLRLVIQNVLFSALDCSPDTTPVEIHASNRLQRGANSFSLALTVRGDPLKSIVRASLYDATKSKHTFSFEGSGIGQILAASLLEMLGGELIMTNHLDGTNTLTILLPLPPQHAAA